MRLLGVAMVSNEADVIEAFVRHNLRRLDALVVLNHRSVDDTEEILTRLAAEGLPLTVLRDADPAFRQGERITMMARRYLPELGCDFCFALDADEFVMAPSRDALEAALARLGPGRVGWIPLRNYFPTSADSPAERDPLRRFAWRLKSEVATARKVVLPAAFAGDPASQVSLGNHAAVRVREQGTAEPWPHVMLEGPFLAHFPVRSPEQVAKKALLGWMGTRLWRPERYMRPGQTTPAQHWGDLFARLRKGEKPDFAFMREAMAPKVSAG